MVMREALLREHHRGGQSFIVVPRIADMPISRSGCAAGAGGEGDMSSRMARWARARSRSG
jgi:hypothetical protein